MASPHTAVKQELLVRYLDAWLPAALHGHKRVCLVLATPSAEIVAAAAGVLAELADLLEGRALTVVTDLAMDVPEGTQVTASWSPKLGLPLALLDGSDDLLDAVVAVKGAQVLAFLPEAREAGTPFRCIVELVARDRTQALVFGTPSEKALEKFKDELWALDEFAGVQLRDPSDPELLDISLQPHPGPLRRMLAARLAQVGPAPVSELRTWTVRHTVYRAADTARALQAMLAAGDASRTPVSGRLTPTTLISPA